MTALSHPLRFWAGLAAAFALLGVDACPGTSPSPAPAAEEPLALALDAATAHQCTVTTPAPGIWEVATSGVDPFVATQTFNPPPGGRRILSFECLCLERVGPFEVFVGSPWNESCKVTADGFPYSEGWQTFSIDLGPALEKTRRPPGRLRLDFGSAPGRTLQVRNLRLRLPDAGERERAADRERRMAAAAALERDLENYLNGSWPVALTDVRVGAASVRIAGRVTGKVRGELWLAEAQLWQPVARAPSVERVARLSALAPDGTFAMEVPRRFSQGGLSKDGSERDRLLTRWLVVAAGERGDVIVSAVRYADAVEALRDPPPACLRSKKGLGGYQAGRPGLEGELDRLGIDSITVNLALNRYLRAGPGPGCVAFTYCGRTFHADGRALASLDRTLADAAARRAVVLGIILVPKAGDWGSPELGRAMQHPDCEPAGIFSMANVTSAEGVLHYAAILDFLAERYSRPQSPFGRIHHWIVHNEVDAGWTWTNCGEKPPRTYVDQYHKSMRIVHLIARQYDPHARAYASLTHYWTETASVRYTPSREVLRHLLAFSRTEGDFDWGIAFHPYPESLREPKTWLDRRAIFSFDTPLITFRNIEVLDAWVRLPEQRFQGRTTRSVHLSEQGPNSPDYGPTALAEQAASMAYVWKKIQGLGAIEAFQFHNWVDNRHEGGLRIGLRRFPDDSEEPLAPKPVWHLYRALGTPDEEAACAPYLPVAGLRSWDEAPYRGAIGGTP